MSADNPELWREIKSIAADALEQPESDRERWVRSACGEDSAKLAAVLQLLGFADVLEEITVTMNGPQSRGRFSGNKIGPYQVHWPLGAGGVGEVYLATRVENVRMRVAIKFLRPDCTHPGLVRRFRGEAQILAALDHPNIVKLLDAGETSDGQPYFVMEYVEGSPIDRWCADHQAALHKRLNLFRAVCESVQYAHGHLLVHSDLKPGNILVTSDGVVKLLDFGIARLLRPELLGGMGDDMPTANWEQPLTPAYGSPEQLRGQPVSTSSDIYALGVILFELLTGDVPFSPKKSPTWKDFVKVVQEERPSRPSTIQRVPTSKEVKGPPLSTFAHRLSAELDNIVLKALEKVPERRYLTAQEMGDDIDRYLHGLPVRAHPDSFAYRAGKFAKRHMFAIAASGAVVASLAGGLVVSLHEKAAADERLAQVGRLASEITQSFSKVEAACLPISPAQRAVNAAEVRIAQSPQNAELQDQLASSYTVLADMLTSNHQNEQARLVIDKLISLEKRISQDRPGDLKAKQELEGVVARFTKSQTLGYAGPGTSADIPQNEAEVARGFLEAGNILRLSGESGAAEQAYRASIERYESLAKGDPSNKDCQEQLGRARAAMKQ